MAIAKTAELIRVSPQNDESSLLEFHVAADDFSRFQGGRYIILDTGLRLDDEKTIKRAYSVVSADRLNRKITIRIKPISNGYASRHMASAATGSIFSFSGPWGKLELPHEDSPDYSLCRCVVLIASYTGVSALIGILNEISLSPFAIDLIWYRPSQSYFIEDETVIGLAREKRVKLAIVDCPRVEDPDQQDFFAKDLSDRLAKPYDLALMAGDGKVNRIARVLLEDQGLGSDKIIEEIFFNKAKS